MSERDDSPKPSLADRMRADWDDAHDFDPRDPLFGLSREALSGPRLPRRTVLRLLAASGALTAAHLVPNLGVRDARAQGKAGGELVAGWAGVGEMQTFDPARINAVLLFQISSNVLSGLMHIDADLVARGDLAETWTVSEDGKEYVFKLREGVLFHNGDKFTADDVVYTFKRSKDPDKSIHTSVLANVNDAVKVDDYTVKFVLGAPQASFLNKTLERSSGRAMTIVSRRAIEEMGDAQYGLMTVGTGPFRITKHELGQGVVLEKFDAYYDPERPKLDKITIKPIIDPEPLAAALEAGDIQLIGGNPVAPELVDRFQSNPDLVVDIVPGPGFQSVWLNPHVEPFKVADFSKSFEELKKDKGFMVRLALAKGFDRERYIKQAQFGRGIPAYGSINPAMGFFFDPTLGERSEQRYDLEGARKLLADAGYPEGKGFPKLSIKCTPSARREVQVIKNIWKTNLGIDIDLQTMDFPVMLEDWAKMDYQLLRVGSGGDYDPDDGLVDFMQTGSKFNGRRRDKATMAFGNFGDPEVDRLVDLQSTVTDPDKRKALVQEANKLTSDKVASVFLFHPVDVLVHHKRVNFPKESRIPGLVDLDRTTIS
ncbi:MAG: ABC transporter substrate-binding protein [Ectothiorhodospiraceae bacterium]|nr:ABC transporter substrate-binding protein [Chromatiales bacterium]MCP5156004.1 ABC transporter substrate-binding protein [Ectothiorhodospiraceae bacterium]